MAVKLWDQEMKRCRSLSLGPGPCVVRSVCRGKVSRAVYSTSFAEEGSKRESTRGHTNTGNPNRRIKLRFKLNDDGRFNRRHLNAKQLQM